MKKGDLVRSIKYNRGVGVITRVFNSSSGLIVTAFWPRDGIVSHIENIDTLQKISKRDLEPTKLKKL